MHVLGHRTVVVLRVQTHEDCWSMRGDRFAGLSQTLFFNRVRGDHAEALWLHFDLLRKTGTAFVPDNLERPPGVVANAKLQRNPSTSAATVGNKQKVSDKTT